MNGEWPTPRPAVTPKKMVGIQQAAFVPIKKAIFLAMMRSSGERALVEWTDVTIA